MTAAALTAIGNPARSRIKNGPGWVPYPCRELRSKGGTPHGPTLLRASNEGSRGRFVNVLLENPAPKAKSKRLYPAQEPSNCIFSKKMLLGQILPDTPILIFP